MNEEEIWKDIEGYEGYYQISDLGRAKRLSRDIVQKNGRRRHFKEIIMSQRGGKYASISLFTDGEWKQFMIHRLVATHFIPNPENKPQVNHKDGNKRNNNKTNLEWTTVSENAKHAFDNNLRVAIRGEKVKTSKLTTEDVIEIKKLLMESSMSGAAIGRMFGVNKSNISQIKLGKRWGHI